MAVSGSGSTSPLKYIEYGLPQTQNKITVYPIFYLLKGNSRIWAVGMELKNFRGPGLPIQGVDQALHSSYRLNSPTGDYIGEHSRCYQGGFWAHKNLDRNAEHCAVDAGNLAPSGSKGI